MRPASRTWGWLDGYRLSFELPVGPGERGVANVVAEDGARVCGVLYRISVEDAARLDRTEGVHGGLYQRIPVVVSTAAAGRIDAFTYQSQYVTPGRKPSARYLGLLLDGAREHGLPEEYVSVLRAYELARDERLNEL